MGLFAIRRTETPEHPAHAALRANVAADARLAAQLQSIAELEDACVTDIAAAARATTRVQALRDALDAQRGAARYEGQRIDTSTHERELTDALAVESRLASASRAATHARQRFQDDRQRLQAERAQLRTARASLLHGALLEQLAGLQPEFEQAEAAYKRIHRQAFTIARAADDLRMS